MQIEVTLSQKLPKQVKFHDENRHLRVINIGYEWKPIICEHCKMLGHLSSDCKKKKGSKIWVAKAPSKNVVPSEVSKEGFAQVVKPVQVRKEVPQPVIVGDSFYVLEQEDVEKGEIDGVAVMLAGKGVDVVAGGGRPPDTHGQG